MGDRCYMSVTCRRQDKGRFEELFFCADEHVQRRVALVESGPTYHGVLVLTGQLLEFVLELVQHVTTMRLLLLEDVVSLDFQPDLEVSSGPKLHCDAATLVTVRFNRCLQQPLLCAQRP